MTLGIDGKVSRAITFDTAQLRQFDHGYAGTSHTSQGLTAGRVLAHIDTDGPRGLINTRLAYVAISRAARDSRVYTNNAENLGQRPASDTSKTAAIELRHEGTAKEVQRAVSAFRHNDPLTRTAVLQTQGRILEYVSPDGRGIPNDRLTSGQEIDVSDSQLAVGRGARSQSVAISKEGFSIDR
jgi:hypothetical protein